MHHYIRIARAPARLAILPGAFNPPTRAHLAMAEAALSVVDEMLFALPRAFPHKQYDGANFEQRLELLKAAIAGHPQFSLAVTDGGLFIEMAREARAAYGDSVAISLLCGADAAERIAGWDYGAGAGIRDQLREFELLVASRGGPFEPPAEISDRVRSITLPAGADLISSTEVRRRIRAGEPWQDLVPPSVAEVIERRWSVWL